MSLLSTNWVPANTDNETPDIDDDSSGLKYARGTNGIVLVYSHGPYTREQNDTNQFFKTHRFPVTLKVYATTRAKLDSLLGECERIYNAVKDEPDAFWDWIKDLGETPQKDYPDVFDTWQMWEMVSHSRPEAT